MKKMKKSVSRIIRIDENLDVMIRYRLSWLAKKGLVRQYHYKPDDFFRSDNLAWRARLDDVPNVFGISQVIISAARNGMPWQELIAKGLIPLSNYRQARELYNDVVAFPFAGEPLEDSEEEK